MTSPEFLFPKRASVYLKYATIGDSQRLKEIPCRHGVSRGVIASERDTLRIGRILKFIGCFIEMLLCLIMNLRRPHRAHPKIWSELSCLFKEKGIEPSTRRNFSFVLELVSS
jgi:hypothetical protein